MALESYTCSIFRLAAAIYRCRIEVVDTIFYCLVNKSVDCLLVYLASRLAFFVCECRPAHASISQQRHLVAGIRIGAIGHLSLWQFAVCNVFLYHRILFIVATCSCYCRCCYSKTKFF